MTTYITFVLDETGSMQNMKAEAIGGFNKYLDAVAAAKGRIKFSLLKFDSMKLDWAVNNQPIKKVEHLNERTYQPGATTPLWDAVAEAILETEKRVKRAKDPDVVVTVLTDGYENASSKYSAEQVKLMIEDHSDWAFSFVAVGIDAWHAREAGFHKGAEVSAPRTKEGLDVSFDRLSQATERYVNAPKSEKAALSIDFFTDLEEEAEEEKIQKLDQLQTVRRGAHQK